MSEYLNRTYKLQDKADPAAMPFHAIVIAEDDKTVTYVDRGHPSVGVPRAHFAELIVEETEHEKPHLPLKAVKAEQAKHDAVVKQAKASEQHQPAPVVPKFEPAKK